LKTGKTFNIYWASSSIYHTDWSPAANADLDTIKKILNPNGDSRNWENIYSWSWDPRPGVVTVNGRRIAVGFHLRPHAQFFGRADSIPWPLVNASNNSPGKDQEWPMGGHMCMYYGDSKNNDT